MTTTTNTRPAFMKDAKKIAEADAGRKLTYGHIWIMESMGTTPEGKHEVRVCYERPKFKGWFVCRVPLFVGREELDAYEEFQLNREVA